MRWGCWDKTGLTCFGVGGVTGCEGNTRVCPWCTCGGEIVVLVCGGIDAV